MNSDIVQISALSERDLQGWRELASASVEPNPFVEPDFVLPATRAWSADDVAVLRVMDRATWLAAVPVQNVTSWRAVPGRCLVAWRHPYCYLSNPLVSPGNVESVVSALLRRGSRDTGCFGLEWIATDGPFGMALEQQPRVSEIARFDRAALYGGSTGNAGRPPSRQTAKKFRQKRRLLERDSGELTVRDRSGDGAAYERFLEIEAAGWRGASGSGTAMACLPGHGKFFTDMCEHFAAMGRLRLRALESDGRIIAIGSDLIAGDVLYFFKQTFEERYARYSPGAQLELANMEAFRSEAWKMFDSCAGPDNTTYNRLWPAQRTLRTVIVAARGQAGTLSHAKWRAAIAMKPFARRLQEARRRGA